MGDFNVDPKSGKLDDFLNSHVLFNHIKANTCFKSETGSCIDLILSNQKHSLQNTGSFDCGLSDHHFLIHTTLKASYCKLPPKKIFYRCYKNFFQINFDNDLLRNMSIFYSSNFDYNTFENIFESVLDKHAPLKSKTIRGNEKPHMNKCLKKAIMKRTRLWNKYRKTRCSEDLSAYRRQRNLITKINKKAKLDHFSQAIEAQKNNSKSFWRSCKPFFANSAAVDTELSLKINGHLIHDSHEIANIFNVYYHEITKSLNLFDWNPLYSPKHLDPVESAIDKFKNHPSIIQIRSNCDYLDNSFGLSEISVAEVGKLVMKMDGTKRSGGKIPTKILKSSSHVICKFISNGINQSIKTCKFPNRLKLAEITPIPKKGDNQNVADYRPISILPTISKIFEKAISNQLSAFFKSKFSNILCGFRKGHSTQHALIKLLSSWQKSLDQGEIVGTILMDLSKAYDCLPHDLLIAKLAAYGVDLPTLKLLQNYLSERQQRVRIGTSFSKWLGISSGVPQGSILGPLLFNIFINDFFFFIKEVEVCNFADDNSLYTSHHVIDVVQKRLEKESKNALNWFKVNSMAANPAKFQTMFLGLKGTSEIFMNFDGVQVKSSTFVKLLGVYIDSKLNFSKHVQNLCGSASQKTKALLCIRPFINNECAKQLCSAFIFSIFKYCPLIWMFGSKSNNGLINKTHKRALRVIHRDFGASLDSLLDKDQCRTIHVQNLRALMVEIYKSLNNLNPSFMRDLFQTKTPRYNLRSGLILELPETKSHKFGVNSLIFRGSLTWNSLSPSLKSATSVKSFKKLLNSWDGKTCTCFICN